MNEINDKAISRPLYRGVQIVWYVLGLLEIVLGFRFILKLLGANPEAGFTSFVYSVSDPFVAPFLNVFKITRVEGSIFEWTTMLAMMVYWLIAWAIVRLLVMGKPINTVEADNKLDREE